MLSVSEALARVLSSFPALASEWVFTQDAAARVLAEPVTASLNLPSFPNSSMDGYAVRAADVQAATEANPTILNVIGDIPAGIKPALRVEPGTAARIMTGAHVPEGADAVIPVEATGAARSEVDSLPPATIQIRQPVSAGAYIRPTGEDVHVGDRVLEAGRILRAYDLGVLAAFGLTQVKVVRRPRVAILSTGDELVDISQTPGPGQIRDSNSSTLAALVQKYGGDPVLLGVARDRAEVVAEKLQAAVESQVDLIVSSAGVSVGAYDVVKLVVEAAGELNFWKVNMRPGKPLAFGQYQAIPFFGLPGNPVSAIVSFELFVRPAILKLGGQTKLEKPTVKAVLAEAQHSDGRESYLRAVVTKTGDQYQARSAGGQGSNILSALVNANALLVIPEGVTEVPAGSVMQAWMLDWSEEVF